MLSLLCTAGGARGAYQAGILKRIGELKGIGNRPSPFKIVSGASAGAINGAAVATGSLDFRRTTETLDELWSSLQLSDIIRTDAASLGGIAAKWIKDLSFGGLVGGGNAQSLLDSSPLIGYLKKHLNLDGIQESIDRGALYAVAIAATNYNSGKSYTFIQGREGHALWTKSRKLSYSVKLGVEHIAGSCAIPLVFQPVLIDAPFGDYYYGDGALRLVNPFSAPIRLGATRVLAISIRAEKSISVSESPSGTSKPLAKKPTLAAVFGVSLNAIFLDHLDADYDHLKRLNDIISSIPADVLSKLKEPMKVVDPLILKPSLDIGQIADAYADYMPKTIRYLMEGLGSSRNESADLMSYLLFDNHYTRALVDLGYKDASNRIDEIEDFIFKEPAPTA